MSDEENPHTGLFAQTRGDSNKRNLYSIRRRMTLSSIRPSRNIPRPRGHAQRQPAGIFPFCKCHLRYFLFNNITQFNKTKNAWFNSRLQTKIWIQLKAAQLLRVNGWVMIWTESTGRGGGGGGIHVSKTCFYSRNVGGGGGRHCFRNRSILSSH